MDIIFGINTKKFGKGNFILRPLKFTAQFLTIGDNCFINKSSRIEGISQYEGIKYNPLILIGDNVSIQQNLHLTCANRIVIHNDVAIGANVTITDIDHPYDNIEMPIEKAQLVVHFVEIGAESKIYNNAVILPGTVLGKHCVVGANSVVSGVFPDYSVIVGAPAKIIKRYCAVRKGWFRTGAKGDFLESINV